MKTMRWMFFFDEGNVSSDVTTDEEGYRIRTFLKKNPKGVLTLPGKDCEIWVNLDMVKAISHREVDLEAERRSQEQSQEQKA